MSYKVLAYGLSDVGLVRQQNEDVWAQLPDERFFVLADGMGGHQAGEIAAKEAAERLCALFKERYSSSTSLRDSREIVFEAIQQVNYIIYKMGHSRPDLKGMGTTLCCVLLHPEGLIYGHVGDSRIYRFRHHRLEQLTKDHSLLRELIDLGQLQEQQAEDFIYKHILTKAVGTEPDVEPAVNIESLEAGDIILMCSDGLTDMLNFEEIQHIIKSTPVKDVAHKLIKTAKQKGGHDNVTVVVVKVQGKHETTDLS